MKPRISVIGTGYLGATHAAGMAELGFDVLGVDVDTSKIATLARGTSPFYEPGLQTLIAEHVSSGRLGFTTSVAEAADFADVHFLCVGTPQQKATGAADLTHVYAAIRDLAKHHLRQGALIVGKSTVPVGTAAKLAVEVSRLTRPDLDVELAWNPEFLREGYAVQDTLFPNRLVFGVGSAGAELRLRDIYSAAIGRGTAVVATDLATSELVKMAANSFLATKISFINAMAELCDQAGADVDALADALGHDERIGREFLNAGLGYGGGCLPKDVRALIASADELGAHSGPRLLRQVDHVNSSLRSALVEQVRMLAGGNVSGRRIAVLGASFKPLSDDVRDSPALNVAVRLHGQGAEVSVHDPEAIENARRCAPELLYFDEPVQACAGADIVLHLTDWPQYKRIDIGELSRVVARRCLIDARNALDPEPWRRAGWSVDRLRHSEPALSDDHLELV